MEENKDLQVVEFKGLKTEDGYYTLDGEKKIDNPFYRKIINIDLSELTIEEKFYLIKQNNAFANLKNAL